MRELKDNNCQNHSIFCGLHQSNARYNVVRMEEEQMYKESHIIARKCHEYCTNMFVSGHN